MNDKPTYEELEKEIFLLRKMIDNQKRIEDNLREIEKLAMIGYWDWDYENGLLTWSDEIFNIFGVTKGEFKVTAENFEKAIHPDDKEFFLIEREKALNAGENVNIIHRIIKPSGEIRIVQERVITICENSHIIRLLGTVQDITEQKQTEQRLQAENERSEGTMNSIDAAIYVIDLETYELLFTNKYFTNLFGENIGKKCYSVIQKNQTSECSFCTNRILLDKSRDTLQPYIWTFQNTITNRWYQLHDHIIKWSNGKLVRLEFAIDITDLKKIEFELREAKEKSEISENLLKEAQALAKTGNWELDIINNKLYWSDEIYRIFNCKPQEFGATYEAFLNFIYPEDREFVNNAYTNHINTKIPYDIIHRIQLSHGEIKYVNEKCKTDFEKNGKPIRSVGTVTDITEKILTEKKLQKEKEKAEENEEKFRSLSENSLDYIMRYDRDLRHIYMNKFAIEASGGSMEKIIGKTHREAGIYDEKQCEMWEQKIETVFKSKQPYSEQFSWESVNGTIYLDWRLFPEFNDKNEVISVLGVSRDITYLKNTENELIKAKEKAEESDRLKTAFLQNLSHEIRTPLNAISGFSGLLDKPELSEEKRKSFVSIIQNSSNQLISIITDILTISSLETKQEKANINKVCINNIIVDLLSIFKQQAQNQNISIYAKQQLNDKQSEIFTDKTKITQILTNLLTNALKFTHEGFIEFGYKLKENELEFYVKDSGIGIKSEFQEKIFERFRQADKSINKLYGGTGLGLAISKAFAELLGGKIWVKSALEKGSTFYFTIPYKPVNEIDKTTTPTKQNENFRKILVAEDEEFNFLYIEELLIDMDLKLIHAKDGQETVEIFKANPNIDLILMDIKMPIMTGHEAAIVIKEINPNIPIVAQSAYALEHERAKYEGIFDDYLTKPINESVLKQMVMKYIDIQKKE